MNTGLIIFIVAILLVVLHAPYIGILATIGGLYAFISFIVGLVPPRNPNP